MGRKHRATRLSACTAPTSSLVSHGTVYSFTLLRIRSHSLAPALVGNRHLTMISMRQFHRVSTLSDAVSNRWCIWADERLLYCSSLPMNSYTKLDTHVLNSWHHVDSTRKRISLSPSNCRDKSSGTPTMECCLSNCWRLASKGCCRMWNRVGRR